MWILINKFAIFVVSFLKNNNDEKVNFLYFSERFENQDKLWVVKDGYGVWRTRLKVRFQAETEFNTAWNDFATVKLFKHKS